MNHSNWMIPDAHENWRSLLYEEQQIIANRRELFAGHDFENRTFFDIDETPLIYFMDLSKNTYTLYTLKKDKTIWLVINFH